LITVLVADDHWFMRATLVDLFAESDDITVAATCADGTEVVPAALRTDPDVVLMDVGMGEVTGLEAARALLQVRPDARVLMLSGSLSGAAVREAVSLGVRGFLLKGDDPALLTERIREVAAGGSAWSPATEGYLPAPG
jgi:DNA-binding NarL/FixJ family response regulator